MERPSSAGSETARKISGILLFDDECDSPWAAKEITQRHWVPTKNVSSCMNTSNCSIKFWPFKLKHHCRRCGQVFCQRCLEFSLRLNKLAQPDPDGEHYKVCQICFDQSGVSELEEPRPSRSHTQFFMSERKMSRDRAFLNSLPGSDPKKFLNWLQTNLNFEKEFQRLLKGYEAEVDKSKIGRALVELRSNLKTPKWLKPKLWKIAKMAECCHMCNNTFDGQLSRSYCRVCGIHVCKTSDCSSKDLLLYIPDKDKEKSEPRKPSLAIIRIVGSPDVEPVLSLNLRVCLLCKNHIVQRQVKRHEESDNTWTGQKFNNALAALNERFKEGEDLIRELLPSFSDSVDTLEEFELVENQVNIKHLTKIQADLEAAFDRHYSLVDHLKKLRAVTSNQGSIMTRYVQAKRDFYLNNISVFKATKEKMEELIKHRNEAQKAEDRSGESDRLLQEDPLMGAHVLIHQLMTETADLCAAHNLQQHNNISDCIRRVKSAIICDVLEYFKSKTEDKKAHSATVLSLAETRVKNNRLIRPSESVLSKRGSRYLYDLMLTHTEQALTQIYTITHPHANRKVLPRTVDAVGIALEELSCAFEQDFVFVERRNE